jgi:hypothetical protein
LQSVLLCHCHCFEILSQACGFIDWGDCFLFFQPMLDTVKMHPLLVTASKEAETGTARYMLFSSCLYHRFLHLVICKWCQIWCIMPYYHDMVNIPLYLKQYVQFRLPNLNDFYKGTHFLPCSSHMFVIESMFYHGNLTFLHVKLWLKVIRMRQFNRVGLKHLLFSTFWVGRDTELKLQALPTM